MLTEQMKWIVRSFNAASVASVNDDGTPAVSVKATFVIVDDVTLAFGDIRSPKTLHNLRQRPEVELNFIDILHRRALRASGTASIVDRETGAWDALEPMFTEIWAPYLDMMSHFVVIHLSQASLITSPAYDIGIGEAELKATNLEKLNSL